MGEEDRGEDTFGRWSNPKKMGVATESMVFAAGGESFEQLGMCAFLGERFDVRVMLGSAWEGF